MSSWQPLARLCTGSIASMPRETVQGSVLLVCGISSETKHLRAQGFHRMRVEAWNERSEQWKVGAGHDPVGNEGLGPVRDGVATQGVLPGF